MSVSRRSRAQGEEPSATIYVPAWLDARARLVWVDDEDARALLASAMDQVESGWEAVRAVQRWADRYPEAERVDDDYGPLLTFAESELREVFREIASDLAAWVLGWPGGGLDAHVDLNASLSEFGRYASVLVLATQGAVGVPRSFRRLVRQVARLRPAGEWALRLGATFTAIQDVSDAEITAVDARHAVDFLVHALPEPERHHRGGLLVLDLETEYAAAGHPSPTWLGLVKEYFGCGPSSDRPGEQH